METSKGADMGYRTHYVVDGGKARVILGVLVTPSEVMDNQPMRDLIFRTRFRWKLWPRQVTGDTKYGTTDNIVAMEREHIHAYVPIADLTRAAPLSFVKRTSTMMPSAMCTCVRQAKNSVWIDLILPSGRCAIEHVPRSAITVRSKRSVPRVNRGGHSVAVWRRSIWIESEATMRPKMTRRPIANAVSGSNRYLRKAKTCMACDAFAYGSSGASTVRRSREQRGKISSGCSKNEAGDGGHSQQRPFLSSFWLLVRG